jgi:hypothetical protein
MRTLLLVLLVSLLAACDGGRTLVVIERFAPGNLQRGDGGTGEYARPQLDILVKLEADASEFEPEDLMRVRVNGVDRTADILIGGEYALIRIDPAPVGTPQFTELLRNFGDDVHDTFTWVALPYTGPTLTSVDPQETQVGDMVAITGTGFSAAPVRVFFGGVEGTVDSSDDTSIVATVPAGALPGLVWVLVGSEAAEGVVGFQPLDDQGVAVPLPTRTTLFAAFPASGGIETPVKFYGVDFSIDGRPHFNDRSATRLFGIEVVNVPPIGDILRGFGVVFEGTRTEAGDVRLIDDDQSNRLPFTVTD